SNRRPRRLARHSNQFANTRLREGLFVFREGAEHGTRGACAPFSFAQSQHSVSRSFRSHSSLPKETFHRCARPPCRSSPAIRISVSGRRRTTSPTPSRCIGPANRIG